MRDDPYPARFYGRHVDESFLRDAATTLPFDDSNNSIFPFPQSLQRVLLLLMTLYLGCALFLIFAVTSYAAPLGSATIDSQMAVSCVETATTSVR